jgi:hypothetical protein
MPPVPGLPKRATVEPSLAIFVDGDDRHQRMITESLNKQRMRITHK